MPSYQMNTVNRVLVAFSRDPRLNGFSTILIQRRSFSVSQLGPSQENTQRDDPFTAATRLSMLDTLIRT